MVNRNNSINMVIAHFNMYLKKISHGSKNEKEKSFTSYGIGKL